MYQLLLFRPLFLRPTHDDEAQDKLYYPFIDGYRDNVSLVRTEVPFFAKILNI